MSNFHVFSDYVGNKGFKTAEEAMAHCKKFGYLTPRAKVYIERMSADGPDYEWDGEKFVEVLQND